MFDYLEINMWKDGTEHCVAYADFNLDERQIWFGTKYCLCNNHIKNNWEIHLWNTNTFKGVVASGKEDTLSLKQFKDWLLQHEVKDGYMDYLRNHAGYVKSYPKLSGAQFIHN